MVRSDRVAKGATRAPHRSLLKALGFINEEIGKPIIGIANSFNEIIPGHVHLKNLVQAVKDGIREAGGIPMEFNTIGICDGLAMNHIGMKYSLVTRNIIADSIEASAMATPFDAMVFIPNCDKVVPGMLIAAARLNLPSVFVSGGAMLAGVHNGKKIGLSDVFEAVGKFEAGLISEEELELLQKAIEENYNALSEVSYAAFSLEPISDERLVEIAKDVNEQLGYELYDKLDRESLVADFSTTTREMYKYTLDKSKFLNDRLEKALVEHCDDILVDVVKAHENFDSMETYELYTLAFEVNEKLGYRLFRDIYSYSLRRDFERVAKAVEIYKKEGKITKFMK